MTRHFSVDLEVEDGKYTIVLSEAGTEARRFVYATEAEARAALKRGWDKSLTQKEVKEVSMTREGAAFVQGASAEDAAKRRHDA